MTDTFAADGQRIRLFESGGIFQYLVDEYDQGQHKISFPRGTREYYEMINWTYFQNAGLGPMQGQANHFVRYAPEKIEYGMKRYVNETRRLYSVLEHKLEGREYLLGTYGIADIKVFGWARYLPRTGVPLEEFPNVKAWVERIEARPAVQRGIATATPSEN